MEPTEELLARVAWLERDTERIRAFNVSSSGTPATADYSQAGGRLTLTTGTPVTTADVTSAGTLYYTPYLHNRLALYSSGAWAECTFSERSLSLTLTSGSVYDVFAYSNSGTVTLETLVWTSATARATDLTTQDGVLVKNGDATRRYLGTIYASGTNTTEDSAKLRAVWNYYNRVPRQMYCTDTTDSWTYNSATPREARAQSTLGVSRFGFVIGVAGAYVSATNQSFGYIASSSLTVNPAIGLDSATTASQMFGGVVSVGNTTIGTLAAQYKGYPAIGYHFLCRTESEFTTTTTNWIGDNGVPAFLSAGMIGEIFG